jgi:DNA-cytosine methyltransferase
MITLGSLFSGIGTESLTARAAGIEPIYECEIEPCACAVAAKHEPNVPNLGDITLLNGANIPLADIVFATSPCTSFSMAGQRAGFNGESALFLEFIRVVREQLAATNNKYPKALVFENVMGTLSSKVDNDFKAFLREQNTEFYNFVYSVAENETNAFRFIIKLIQALGYDADANMHVASDFGTPQMRERIEIVGIMPGKAKRVLNLERNYRKNIVKKLTSDLGLVTGLCTYAYEPVKGKKVKELLERCVLLKYVLSETACAGILRRTYIKNREIDESLKLVLENSGEFWKRVKERLGEKPDRENIFVATCYNADIVPYNNMRVFGDGEKSDLGIGKENGDMYTLPRNHSHGIFLYENHSLDSRYKKMNDNHNALTTYMGTGGNNESIVVETVNQIHYSAYTVGGNSPTLRHDGGVLGGGSECLVIYAPCLIRKTTPLECTRIMNLPDDYFDGLNLTDAQKYRMLGNGIIGVREDNMRSQWLNILNNIKEKLI